MPRDGAQVYHVPAGTTAVTDTTIDSAKYNAFVGDVEQDLNTPRPIVAGGTGATSAAGAMANFGGELAKQVITNYDSATFVAGSFYSAAGATSAPVAGHSFSGICYVTDASNMVIEARDLDDVTQPGDKWTRQMKAGVWSAWSSLATASSGRACYISDTAPAGAPPNALWWKSDTGILYVRYNDGDSVQWVMATPLPDTSIYLSKSGGTMTGALTLNGNPVGPLDATPKQYVDAADALLAPLASPALTGNPTCPNQLSTDISTKIANTATVDGQIRAQAATGTGNMVRQVNPSITNPTVSNGYFYNISLNNTGMDNGGADNTGVGMYFYHFSPTNFSGMGCDGSGAVVCDSAQDWYWATSGGGGQKMHLVASGTLYVAGTYQTSDARLKDKVETLQPSIIDRLRPVAFNWKDAERGTERQFGFIAQEVQAVAPNLVSAGLKDKDGIDLLCLNTAGLIPELVAELQALRARVAALEGGK